MDIYKVLAQRERILIQERALNAAVNALKKMREPLDEQIESYLGDEKEVEVSKWIIKRQERAAYEVPAGSHVAVRVNRPKLVKLVA